MTLEEFTLAYGGENINIVIYSVDGFDNDEEPLFEGIMYASYIPPYVDRDLLDCAVVNWSFSQDGLLIIIDY